MGSVAKLSDLNVLLRSALRSFAHIVTLNLVSPHYKHCIFYIALSFMVL